MKKRNLLFIYFLLLLQTNAQVGQIAPDFKVTDTHGDQHRLYDYLEKGKTVVLDFYFTTCIPCQYYSPQVNLVFKKYGCNKKDVVFIAIDYNDSNEEVKAYDAKYQIEYPSISGTEGGGNGVVDAYNVIGFPTFYVIDSSKKIVMEIDPPTLQVFDFRFNQLGLSPKDCELSATTSSSLTTGQNLHSNIIAGQVLTIVSFEPITHNQYLSVFDHIGRPIYTNKIIPAYSNHYDIILPELGKGYYYCTLNSTNGVQIKSVAFIKI
ncbi:MAG: TlpA family protein disulfide reductase [Saprospiraceae bacterium]|nr:TlpA family protein disulfide reductase [Saprospiraceae bacterium]